MQRTLETLDQWKIPFVILVAYWIIAALILSFVNRRWCSTRRAANPARYRFWLALAIAIIFTPSLVGDFWLFAVPAPAILGLLWFIPVGFLAPVYWLVALIYYVLPMALIFWIVYHCAPSSGSSCVSTNRLTMRWSERRTAVRSTFEMISALPLRAIRALVRRRSSCSR